MEDLIKSIKAHLYDKATSPLFGTFAISWLIWNYKFVLVLFSSLPVDERIDYISTFLYPCLSSYFLQGALYPLFTAVVFIFIYPYPAKFVYSFTRKQQKELRKIKQEIEDETPLTIEESRKIRRDMTNLELEFERELERRDSEIQRLKDIIDEHKNVLTETHDAKETSKMVFLDKSYNLDSEQLALLKLVSQGDRPLEKELISLSDIDKVKTEYNLGELLRMELINDFYLDQGKAYKITHEGRTVLVKEGLVD